MNKTQLTLILTFLALLFFMSAPAKTEKIDSSKYYPIENPDIEQGKYLTDILMCSGCHSSFTLENGMQPYNEASRLSGGIKLEIPGYGIAYTKNITSDNETGIGNWNFVELQKAITEGRDRAGKRLVGMNSKNYQTLTNEDLNAIIAYLKNTVPIWHSIPHKQPASLINKIFSGLKLYAPFLEDPTINFHFGDFGQYQSANQKKDTKSSFNSNNAKTVMLAPSSLFRY